MIIGYNLKEVRGREHVFLALNTTSTILSDLTVRKAIAESIDKASITSNVYGNKYYTSSFPLEYGSWLYNSGKNSSFSCNLEQAKQDLVDSGWNYKNQYWQKTYQFDYQFQPNLYALLLSSACLECLSPMPI